MPLAEREIVELSEDLVVVEVLSLLLRGVDVHFVAEGRDYYYCSVLGWIGLG